ncbi:MAG: hypothetical protein F6K18_07045 [Okeania sp. SIO2C2]|uniref:hypothetical protein n=1 Tax=Okeania sp. SIO2C2 TaxID=2607787 RepID=UPI0013B6864B|nr:hypothetical protein [Okeania sp. SIO2C2]NEP86604.1 hypothetical protein [Okeania sp. SIO2C2]
MKKGDRLPVSGKYSIILIHPLSVGKFTEDIQSLTLPSPDREKNYSTIVLAPNFRNIFSESPMKKGDRLPVPDKY